jgi:uncharacterized phiE125 gp8 family phage protein
MPGASPLSAAHRHEAHRLLTPPPCEPLTVAAMQAVLRLADCPEDGPDPNEATQLAQYMAQARSWVEEIKGRAYVTQRWLHSYSDWRAPLRLRPCPVQQILSVTQLDADGRRQLIDPATYWIDTLSEPALLGRRSSCAWQWCAGGALLVDCVAGYVIPLVVDMAWSTFAPTWSGTLRRNDPVTFSAPGGVLPAPLSTQVLYYCCGITATTFQVTTTPSPDPPAPESPPVLLTDAGAGPLYLGAIPELELGLLQLMTAHLYENRTPVMPTQYTELPYTLTTLIEANRVRL